MISTGVAQKRASTLWMAWPSLRTHVREIVLSLLHVIIHVMMPICVTWHWAIFQTAGKFRTHPSPPQEKGRSTGEAEEVFSRNRDNSQHLPLWSGGLVGSASPVEKWWVSGQRSIQFWTRRSWFNSIFVRRVVLSQSLIEFSQAYRVMLIGGPTIKHQLYESSHGPS